FPVRGALPLRDVSGRRLPGPGARGGRLDAGGAARPRPGNGLDLQPPGRFCGTFPVSVVVPDRWRPVGAAVLVPGGTGRALVCRVLAVVPQPAGGDESSERRGARMDRDRPVLRGPARPASLVAVPGIAQRVGVMS